MGGIKSKKTAREKEGSKRAKGAKLIPALVSFGGATLGVM